MLGLEVKSINFRQTVFVCRECGTEFSTKKACKTRTPAYYSWSCYMKSVTKYAGMTFICENCGKDFKTNKAYKGRTPKYCSIKCSGDHAKGKPIIASRTGCAPWNKGKKLSDSIRLSLSEGRKNSLKCKGSNLYNWRGGDETFKERSRIYRNNRRARFVNGGKLDPIFLNNLWVAHQGLCFYCERPLDSDRCLEHLTPLSRGGDNQPFNLVYSCRSCNSKKNKKTLEDYAIANGKIWLVDKWETIFVYAHMRTQEGQCNTENYQN